MSELNTSLSLLPGNHVGKDNSLRATERRSPAASASTSGHVITTDDVPTHKHRRSLSWPIFVPDSSLSTTQMTCPQALVSCVTMSRMNLNSMLSVEPAVSLPGLSRNDLQTSPLGNNM